MLNVRLKVNEFTAVQWTPGCHIEGVVEEPWTDHGARTGGTVGVLTICSIRMVLQPGDWLVTNSGSIRTFDNKYFEEHFEPVSTP